MTEVTSFFDPEPFVQTLQGRLIVNALATDKLSEQVIKQLSVAVKELPEDYTLVVLDALLSNSVHVSLSFSSGKIMDIGQASRLFESQALTSYEQWTNRNVLRNCMIAAEFRHNPRNWQHFSFFSKESLN